jgi:GAF domain-containing protein
VVDSAHEPLGIGAVAELRDAHYRSVLEGIHSLLQGEDDTIAALSTVACELHHAFGYFDWTGFYRLVRPGLLVVGPFQGGHGCLRIELPRGVCGAAASTGVTQIVDDVSAFDGHIACSSSTRSEIVVPLCAPDGRVLAVLDVDSDQPAAFGEVDRRHLQALCADLGRRYS